MGADAAEDSSNVVARLLGALHLPLNRSTAILAGLAALCFACTLGLAVFIASSDVVNFRGVESNVLYSIQKVLAGRALYTDPSSPPFDIVQYSPLYYLLTAGTARAAGLGPGDVHGISLAARAISTFASLLHVAVMYLLAVRVLGARRSLAFIACGLAFVWLAPWNFLCRPDSFLSLFILASIALAGASLAREGIDRRAYILTGLAAVASSAAVLSKQNGLQAPAIILVFLLARRDWRRAAVYGAACVVATLFMFIVSWPWLGPSMLANVVDGLINGYSLRLAVVTTYLPFFSQMAFVTAFSIFVMLDWGRRDRPAIERFLAWTMFFLFSFATVTSIKIGSAHHYYNDFFAVAVVSAAAYVSKHEVHGEPDSMRLRRKGVLVASFLSILLLVQTVSNVRRYGWLQRSSTNTYGARAGIVRLLREELAELPPDFWFLSTDGPLTVLYPERGLAPQAGLAALCHLQGSVDYSAFHELVRRRKVRLLVVPRGKKPAAFLGASLEGFTLQRGVDGYDVFACERAVPRGDSGGHL